VALVVSALGSTPVLAHGGETFVAVEPTTVQPGAGLIVRADLQTSGPVSLVLVATDGSRRDVGVVEETVEGHFEVVILVPADLSSGHWTLLAEADGATMGSAVVEVAGTRVDAETGSEGRDAADPLVVPLPSGWQPSRTNPVATPSSVSGPVAGELDPVPFVVLAATLGALAVLVARTRRPRTSDAADPGR
jgi:hypothetical protein